MKCPLCLSSDSSTYATWSDFNVRQCDDCGFRYIDTSDQNYPARAQYLYDEKEIGTIDPALPHIQRRVRDVLRFKKSLGNVLEIGCGKGEVALALQQIGFDCTGIDMKSRIMVHLKARHPEVDWRSITTSDLAALSERFDVLTMYHVLEHVTDPRSVLASVKALAKPDALIVIEVPNVGGWKARLKGQSWNYYKVDHVNYFRKSDLRKLAGLLELEILDIRGYQHFSFPQNNLFKDFLKGMLALAGFQDVISIFCRVK